MKVKALCGVIYKGKRYDAGKVFEADRVIPNTIQYEKTPESAENPPAESIPENIAEIPELLESPSRPGRRRR